ncbi:MAG: hypothetical protein EXX96DRAFT_583275 [Benjaminiella poitrasii]|nr:MAG: hypothetical protein EXX96DRAFT_583275 [Benjaminiella poitrasii]
MSLTFWLSIIQLSFSLLANNVFSSSLFLLYFDALLLLRFLACLQKAAFLFFIGVSYTFTFSWLILLVSKRVMIYIVLRKVYCEVLYSSISTTTSKPSFSAVFKAL